MSEAHVRGIRPPIRVLDHGTRAWRVADRDDESLLMDEYGDLWWARVGPRDDARVTRACWPEEARALHPAIERSLQGIVAVEQRTAG